MKKENKRKLMEAYDLFCKAADDVMALWDDVCEIKDGNCWRGIEGGTCCMNRYPNKKNPHCPYLGESGCTVQVLRCKLFYCEQMKRRHPALAEIMRCLFYKSEEFFWTIPFAVPREIFESRLGEYKEKGGLYD